MVKGETYDLQLFESEAFRHFINVFTNKQSGITLGCVPSHNTQNINISSGYFFVQGGLLREDIGTSLEIPTDAGYYKLVYEIDLSKTNQKDVFNQGSYKFVKSLGGYPDLMQEELDTEGEVYQLPFCQFRITEQGLQDFDDIRNIIGYSEYKKKENTDVLLIYKTSQEVASQNQTVKFQRSLSVGKKLGFSNNGIKIGKGITHVKVYGQILFNYMSNMNYLSPQIRKNASIVGEKITDINIDTFSASCDVEVPLLEVKEGDIITLNFGDVNNLNPTAREGQGNTFLCVEAINYV